VNIISEMRQEFNINALHKTTFQTLEFIELVNEKPTTLERVMGMLDVSRATAYRLKNKANDTLWNYKVISVDGMFKLIKRPNE